MYYIFSKATYDDHLSGRIDAQVVNLILKEKHKDLSFSDYFLCGPEAMINLVKDTVIENGIDKKNIHFELFITSSKSDTPNMEVESFEGETEITVLLDYEEETFTMDRKKDYSRKCFIKRSRCSILLSRRNL